MFDRALEFIAEGNYLAFAVATVIGLLFNAKNFLSLADNYKKRRIEILKEAISFQPIDEDLKRHFEDEIEGEYFRLAHKVKLDKGLRDATISCYYGLNRAISFSHFIRARSHLDIRNGNLTVTISTFDKFGFWYNLAAGIGMLLYGFSLAAMINALKPPTIVSILILLGMCSFLITFGFYMLLQTFSVISARRIQKAMEQ